MALREVISYEFFTSEAWMIERSVNMIVTGELITNSWIQNDTDAVRYISPPGPLKRIRETLKRLN